MAARASSTAIAAAITLALLPSAARANDSSAELAAGGLVLKRSDSIALLQEELLVSPTRVRVKYVFQNTSAADVTTEVAFPLPDIGPELCGGPEINWPNPRSDNLVDFVTKIDGVQVPLQVELKAYRGPSDITDELARLGLPISVFRGDLDAAVAALPVEMRGKLLRKKVLEEGAEGYCGGWILKTTFHRTQTFPAGRAVTIEHSYTPVIGGTAWSRLEGLERDSDVRRALVEQYCVDTAFERTIARAKRRGGKGFTEEMFGYVLKTGANWAGPIRDFRLVVDKGVSTNLMTLCAAGLRKISATRFELRQRDFTPTRDLDVLLLKPIR